MDYKVILLSILYLTLQTGTSSRFFVHQHQFLNNPRQSFQPSPFFHHQPNLISSRTISTDDHDSDKKLGYRVSISQKVPQLLNKVSLFEHDSNEFFQPQPKFQLQSPTKSFPEIRSFNSNEIHVQNSDKILKAIPAIIESKDFFEEPEAQEFLSSFNRQRQNILSAQHSKENRIQPNHQFYDSISSTSDLKGFIDDSQFQELDNLKPTLQNKKFEHPIHNLQKSDQILRAFPQTLESEVLSLRKGDSQESQELRHLKNKDSNKKYENEIHKFKNSDQILRAFPPSLETEDLLLENFPFNNRLVDIHTSNNQHQNSLPKLATKNNFLHHQHHFTSSVSSSERVEVSLENLFDRQGAQTQFDDRNEQFKHIKDNIQPVHKILESSEQISKKSDILVPNFHIPEQLPQNSFTSSQISRKFESQENSEQNFESSEQREEASRPEHEFSIIDDKLKQFTEHDTSDVQEFNHHLQLQPQPEPRFKADSISHHRLDDQQLQHPARHEPLPKLYPPAKSSSHRITGDLQDFKFWIPKAYSYDYTVHDSNTGSTFGTQEKRDGDQTQGFYYVHLPDGRLQKVSYHVNGESGFVAKVSYEGKIRNAESSY